MRDEYTLKTIEVLVAFGQDQRRTTVTHGSNTSSQIAPISGLVLDQKLVERLELDPFIGIRRSCSDRTRSDEEDRVVERSGRRLRPGVDPMPNGTALHEDDRMVTVLARHRRGQAQDESRLRLSDHLFEAAGRQVVAFIDDDRP